MGPAFTASSAISQIQWPGVPDAMASRVLAVLFQLEQSQWWNAGQHQQKQFQQLQWLIGHAARSVPFYQRRFDESGADIAKLATPESWSQIPLLTRRDIQTAGDQLHSTAVPKDHGQVSTAMTSGSTGQPVKFRRTQLTRLFWKAFTLRDHLWHRRDFGATLAALRYTKVNDAGPPDGKVKANWGSATEGIISTGPGVLLGISSTLAEQADWLARIDPAYVLIYPSALHALAEHIQEHEQRLPGLKELRTFGEVLEDDSRELCRDVFGVKIVDTYSTQELGYLALQCPEHDHYHVQSENVLLEVIDEKGEPCQPGQVGKVVATSLHNFASPLIRYDIGDYAEVGHPCPCGRGLPVLKRILGRQRNMLQLPDGQVRWPAFGEGGRPEELPPVFQFQVVQKTLHEIEVKLVRPAPLTAAEDKQLREYLTQTLGHPFDFTFTYVDEVSRSPSGKYEDFRSELTETP